ncbi:MAG: hypothetical protein ACP6KW_06375 [Candidatus Thorarchaeota archaeon]
MSPDWMMTRITVVLLAVVGPIYFLMLMVFLPFRLEPFADPFWNLLFHFVAVPTVFSAPWVGWIYYKRYRLANAVHIMDETITVVPLRWRIFYGANASFILMIFILPMVTPILAIIGGLVVAGHVFYRIGVGKLGGGKPAAFLGFFVALALCILPAYVMLEFIPEFIPLWQSVLESWNSFWVNVAYGVAQCLVNALSFGAPVYFIYYGAQQYDKGLYGEVYTETPTVWIRIGELILFTVFTIFYLPPIPTALGVIPFLDMSWLFTSYINWISLGIVAIMTLVKMRLGVKQDTTMGGFSNIAVIGLFLVVELFFKTNLVLITVIIWLAFLIYGGLAALSYLRASSGEMY